MEAQLQFQIWTSQQWTPSGTLCRCDLDLIKNLTSYPVQIKPKLPRCSFCLYVTFGSEAAFATGLGRRAHNEGKALKQVQLITEAVQGSFCRPNSLFMRKLHSKYIYISVTSWHTKQAPFLNVSSLREGRRRVGVVRSAHKGKMSSVH